MISEFTTSSGGGVTTLTAPNSITVSGGGVIAFTGSNTYSGGTTINGSTTVLANNATSSLGTPSGTTSGTAITTVNSGLLAGTGVTGGPVVLAGSGTGNISAGTGATAANMIGILSMSDLTPNASAAGTYLVKLDGSHSTPDTTVNSGGVGTGTGLSGTPGTANDELLLTDSTGFNNGGGTVTISPVLITASASLFTAGSNYSYIIADATSNASAFTGLIGTAILPTAGYTLDTKPDGVGGQDLLLDFTAVSTGPVNLFFTGSAGNGTFDVGTTANFTTGTGTSTFQNGNNVTFDDTANGGHNTGFFTINIPAVVSPGSTTVTGTTAYTLTGAGGLAGSGGLTKMGSGSLSLNTTNTYTGPTTITGGAVTLGGVSALPAGTNLTINGSGSALIANTTGNAYALSIGTLNVSGGGIDLKNNALIVHSSTIGAVTPLVASGFNNGTFNGSSGIISSTAASDSKHLTALGVIVNDASGSAGTSPLYGTGGSISTTFAGATPVDGDMLVKYTYFGDTNLNGRVDGTDYGRIDSAFLANRSQPGSVTGWFNGDFNYGGVINGSDYTLIDNAFNSQGAVIAVELATPTAQLGGAGSSAVPEPTTLSLLGMGAAALLGRQRRKLRATEC